MCIYRPSAFHIFRNPKRVKVEGGVAAMRVPSAVAAEEQEEVDHYEILGLPSGEEERMALSYFDVQRAFRSKAWRMKPAVTGSGTDPDAVSRFRQLRRSFDVVKGRIFRRNFAAVCDVARLSREREVAWIVERQRMRALGIVPPLDASRFDRDCDLQHMFVAVPGGRAYLENERGEKIGGEPSPGPGMRN